MKKLVSPFPKEVYRQNASIYKVMANAKRLEILNIIKSGEATVNALSEAIGMRKSNTSQHLSYLRFLGLVKSRRDGKNIYYSITDPDIVAPCKIFNDLRKKHQLKTPQTI